MILETCHSFVFMFYVKNKPEGGEEGQENVRRCNVKNRGDTPVQNAVKLHNVCIWAMEYEISN